MAPTSHLWNCVKTTMIFRAKVTLSILATLMIVAAEQSWKSIPKYKSPPEQVGSAYAYQTWDGRSRIVGEVDHIRVFGDRFNGLSLSPSFSVDGMELKKPEFVKFYLVAFFTGMELQSMTNLNIFVDDALVFEGPLALVTAHDAVTNINTRFEGREIKIPYAVFEGICRSYRVKISTGGSPVWIPVAELQKFRDLRDVVERGGSY